MAINKDLLRQAICDGAFTGTQQNQQGQMQRLPVTPAVLAQIAGMNDEQIQAVLDAYVANKKLALAQQKDNLTKQVASITAQITALTPAV